MKKKIRNIVAKYCHEFNRPKVEENKKLYKRVEKHKKSKMDYFLIFC
jgi:hypothetical protein